MVLHGLENEGRGTSVLCPGANHHKNPSKQTFLVQGFHPVGGEIEHGKVARMALLNNVKRQIQT